MTCDRYRELSTKDFIQEVDERLLADHLDACPLCRDRAARDAFFADPVVAAAAAHGRFHRRVRRAATSALAASILLAGALAIRLARKPESEVRYILRGDSTGVVLTGPGVERRGETLSPQPKKGDRT
jgi:hypothetical protein